MSDKFKIINQLSILSVISALGLRLDGRTQGKVKIRVKCFQCSKPNSTPDLEIDTNTNKLKCYSANCAFNIQNRNNFRVSNFDLAKEYQGKETLAWFEENFPSVKSGQLSKEEKIQIEVNKINMRTPKKYKDFDHIYTFLLSCLADIESNNYLIQNRFLELDIVHKQGIKAYHKSMGKELIKDLKKQFPDQDLYDAGVIRHSEKYNSFYFPLFFSPYVIPIKKDGKIINLQGRDPNPKSDSKYRFLPGRPISQVYIPNHEKVWNYILCEGAITALTHMQTQTENLTQDRFAIALLSINTNTDLLIKELRPYKDALFRLAPDANDKTKMKEIRDALLKNGFQVSSQESDYSVIKEAQEHGLSHKDYYDVEQLKYKIKDINDLLQFLKNKLTLKL